MPHLAVQRNKDKGMDPRLSHPQQSDHSPVPFLCLVRRTAKEGGNEWDRARGPLIEPDSVSVNLSPTHTRPLHQQRRTQTASRGRWAGRWIGRQSIDRSVGRLGDHASAGSLARSQRSCSFPSQMPIR